eukprot:g5525.t1
MDQLKLNEKYKRQKIFDVTLNSCMTNDTYVIESNEQKTYIYTCKGCSVKLVTGRYYKSHVTIKSLNRHNELCKFSVPTLEIGGIYKYQTFEKLVKEKAIHSHIPYNIKNHFRDCKDFLCRGCTDYQIRIRKPKKTKAKGLNYWQLVHYTEHNAQCQGRLEFSDRAWKNILPLQQELLTDPHINNDAKNNHLGLSKPKHTRTTALTTLRIKYGLDENEIHMKQLLYSKSAKVAAKLAKDAVGSVDSYKQLLAWKAKVEALDIDARVRIFGEVDSHYIHHAKIYTGIYYAPGESVRYIRRLVEHSAELSLLQHLELDCTSNSKDGPNNDRGCTFALSALTADKKIILLLVGHSQYNEGGDLYNQVKAMFIYVYKNILEEAAENTEVVEGWDIFMFCDKEKSISNMVDELEFANINFHVKYGIKHREKHVKALDAYKELRVLQREFVIRKLHQMVFCEDMTRLEILRTELGEGTGLAIPEESRREVLLNLGIIVNYLWQTPVAEWTNISGCVRGKTDSSAAESSMQFLRSTSALRLRPLQMMNKLRDKIHLKNIQDKELIEHQDVFLIEIRKVLNEYSTQLAEGIPQITMYDFRVDGVGDEAHPVFTADVKSRFIENKMYQVNDTGCSCGAVDKQYHFCIHQYFVIKRLRQEELLPNMLLANFPFMTKEYQLNLYNDIIDENYTYIKLDELEMIPHSYKRGLLRKPRGRPKRRKRKRNVGSRSYQCSLCGDFGHRFSTCVNEVNPRPVSDCDDFCDCDSREV